MKWPWSKPKDVVVVEWGGSYSEVRNVRRDADGKPYVRLFGDYVFLDDTDRKIRWLSRAQPVADGESHGN